MLIDTHCHLTKDDYDNVDEIINKMPGLMIAAGVDKVSNEELVTLVQGYPKVYAVLGIHPEYADSYSKTDLAFIEQHLADYHIVGIGEIGLDYHYPNVDKEKQKRLFIDQLELANKYQIPVVIHSRDACDDTLKILRQHLRTKAVMHCYSYSKEIALELYQLGVYFGIGGVVTFKNGQKLKQVVATIPLTNLLLETDSPYLTPEPYRGDKNSPDKVTLVATEIARIKGVSYNEVLKVTESNACDIFKF